MFEDLYDSEKKRVAEIGRGIMDKWAQIKEIRVRTGMQTVPWKLNVKEY